MSRFSVRHGLNAQVPIQFRYELPEHLRIPLLKIVRSGRNYRFIVERAEHLFNPYGIGSLPLYDGTMAFAKEEDNADCQTAMRFFRGCEWYQIYDLIEDILAQLYFFEAEIASDDDFHLGRVQKEINDYFEAAGIGWQVLDQKIVAREDEALNSAMKNALESMTKQEQMTSKKNLEEARLALSRRPEANSSGAIFHALGALEGVARDITSDEKGTLGEIIKKHPKLLPPPLDEAIRKLWGYASNEARHVKEGHEPHRHEAELIVGISSIVISYINEKSNT